MKIVITNTTTLINMTGTNKKLYQQYRSFLKKSVKSYDKNHEKAFEYWCKKSDNKISVIAKNLKIDENNYMLCESIYDNQIAVLVR